MSGLPVRVSFRKQVSDSAYGTEAAEISLEGLADGEEDRESLAAALLAEARRMVHEELRNSPSRVVQRSVDYQHEAPPPRVTRAFTQSATQSSSGLPFR